MMIPVAGQDVELQLIKADIFKGGFKVVAASNPDLALDVDTGSHYRGIVKDDTNSLVAMSFFENEIVGAIHVNNQDYTIGKVKETNYHILYKNNDLNHDLSYDCEAIPINNTHDVFVTPTEKSSASDCIRIHLEVDYTLYMGQGSSIDSTINYCTGLFNQVFMMYANESIDMGMSYLKIWDVPSPYGDGTELDDITTQGYAKTYGDLVHLLHQNSTRGLAYVDVICQLTYNAAVSGVNGWYNNIPTYSSDVKIVTHELGHNLGSRHTHYCTWNGNNTQIDDCGNKYWDEDDDEDTEANSCYDPNNPILPPADGGTIMSYCQLIDGVGVGLANGFSTQPGNLIRSKVNSAGCLTTCTTGSTCSDGQQNGNETGIDCGGPDCPVCPTCTDGVLNGNETQIDCGGPDCTACSCTDKIGLSIIINTDFFGNETTWSITDDTGNITYAVGGPYTLGIQTIVETPCLPTGCYNFIIYDRFGDGLSYDVTGDYTVVDEYGNTLASGAGNFGSQQTTNICLQNPCADVELTFNFDESPEEISWYMIDATGNNVGIGGPYTTQGNNSVLTETLCLYDGCYYLLISDSGGNGMCPASNNIFTIPGNGGLGGVRGKNTTDEVEIFDSGITTADQIYTDITTLCGNYTIRDANDGLVTSGGSNFGSSQIRNFCLSGGVATLQHTNDTPAYMKTVQQMNQPTMQVFPTLVQDQLTVAYNVAETKQAQITIFDINGTAIQQQDLNTNITNAQVNVRDLPVGMYFIQLISEGVVLTEKFIKQ